MTQKKKTNKQIKEMTLVSALEKTSAMNLKRIIDTSNFKPENTGLKFRVFV